MGSGILQKCFHILAYGVQLQCLNAGALGRNSEAIPIMTKAFAPASTMFLICHTGSTSTMNSGFITTKHKALFWHIDHFLLVRRVLLACSFRVAHLHRAEYENLLHLESFQV